MKHARSADFYFMGSVILPPIIALGGGIDLAILVFVLLLLVGGVCAMADPEAPHNR